VVEDSEDVVTETGGEETSVGVDDVGSSWMKMLALGGMESIGAEIAIG
jgi:hypothetical protein